MCRSVATATAKPTSRHASPAAGPSYKVLDDDNVAANTQQRPLQLSHHHQVHDDDILPLPMSSESCQNEASQHAPNHQLPQQHKQDNQHHQKGKPHRRRLGGGMATSHLTIDSDYQSVRLAILGAPGVGKSAIVKQFVMQQFPEEYVPTEHRQVFCPAVIINDHLYEVRIIDCPYIPYFPVSSLYEWTDFRGYGLRNATAYILVYDITSEDSFQYIKNIREQILESRDMHDVPLFVVGNKHDLAEERGVPRREVANLVKKQWKCGYVECSAKFNWHIMLLFKELMKSIDYIDYGHKPTSVRVQDALRRNRCFIL